MGTSIMLWHAVLVFQFSLLLLYLLKTRRALDFLLILLQYVSYQFQSERLIETVRSICRMQG